MDSAANALPLQTPFRFEPRNGNSMRNKGKQQTLVPTSSTVTVTTTRWPAAQMVDLEKDTRRWWFSPRL